VRSTNAAPGAFVFTELDAFGHGYSVWPLENPFPPRCCRTAAYDLLHH
jgi:hypothetical protein